MDLTLDKAEALVDDLFAAGARRLGPLRKSSARAPRELIPGALFSLGMRSDDFGQVDVQLFAGLGDLGGELWRQELRTLRAISSVREPALPQFLEGGIVPDHDIAFVVSEGSDQTLVDDGVLEYLAAGENRLLAFRHFRLLLTALRRLHSRGLMHRSVSPAAIDVAFTDPSSAETIVLRLARFEMSALVENVLRHGEGARSAHLWRSGAAWHANANGLNFMPPERLAALQPALRWDALQDIRSDLFGLGVLAYCLFVRQGWLTAEESVDAGMLSSPDAIREALDARRRHLESHAVRRRVPGELRDVIGELMQFERSKRFTAWQAEEALRVAAAAIEASWSSGEEVVESTPRVVSVAPDYFKTTFFETRDEAQRVVTQPPDTDLGRTELREYIERDLMQAQLLFEPDGFALHSGDYRDDKHTGAKYVLVGQTWLYFSAPFRKNPLLKASAMDEVQHIGFVLQRSRAAARRLVEQATLTRVGPVRVVFMKDAATAVSGMPTWGALLRKAELANRTSHSKLRVKYQGALDFVLELGTAQIASRQYACRLQPDGDGPRLLLMPVPEVDEERRRRWTLLWALDRARKLPDFADFFDSLDPPDPTKPLQLRLWPRGKDDRNPRASRSASIVVTLGERMGNSFVVSLPPGKDIKDAPVDNWASPLDDDGSAIVQARQRHAVDEILDRIELLAQIDRPYVVVSDPTGDERFKEGIKGSARDLLDEMSGTWPLYALDGPPGTGKTLMAARAVTSAFFADRSQRLLVAAQSHDALDNMAERIVTTLAHFGLLDLVKCVRVTTPGSENRVSKPMLEYLASTQTDALILGIQRRAAQPRNEVGPALVEIQRRWTAESQRCVGELEDRLRRGANIVFATCGSATPEKLAVAGEDELFDWAIIEEAGRAWLPELALALVRAARWTLIGDYRQLPPYGSEELRRVLEVCEADKNLDEDLQAILAHKDAIYGATSTFKSLFVDASETPRTFSGPAKPSGKLRDQYRMDEPISEIVSYAFYAGELKCKVDRDPYPLYAPSWLANQTLVWLDTSELHAEEQPRWSNSVEARVAATVARTLRVMGAAPVDAVLLSPYRAQLKLLEKYVGVDRDIPIKTVDSFQGKEADVVVVSLVRQNTRPTALGRIGHLDDASRVNVMCSRAKRLLVLVGHYQHFKNTASDAWVEFFKQFPSLGKRLDASRHFAPDGVALAPKGQAQE